MRRRCRKRHVTDALPPRGKRMRLFLKKVLIATSVAIIVVGTALTAMDLLFPDIPPLPNVETLGTPDAACRRRRPRRAGRCRHRRAR